MKCEAHLNLAAIAAMNYDWNLAYEHVLNAEKLDLSNAKMQQQCQKEHYQFLLVSTIEQ